MKGIVQCYRDRTNGSSEIYDDEEAKLARMLTHGTKCLEDLKYRYSKQRKHSSKMENMVNEEMYRKRHVYLNEMFNTDEDDSSSGSTPRDEKKIGNDNEEGFLLIKINEERKQKTKRM